MVMRDHEIEIVMGEETDVDFIMVDEDDHLTGKEGLTPLVEISQNNGAFITAQGTVGEVGKGWYHILLTGLDTGILGSLKFHVTAAGADPVDFVRYIIPKDEWDTKHAIFTTLQSSYCSVEEADNYFDTRLDSDIWTNESVLNKEKALKQATRLIDRLNFVGCRTDEDQLLEFPRSGSDTIPQDICIACCEIALQLLEGRDVELENENIGMQSAALATSRLNINSSDYSIATIHGIPSIVAWNYLKPYLIDREGITLSRIN